MRIAVLVILFINNLAIAQSENLAKLPVRGSVKELGVAPSGEIWMASKAGNVYFTKEFGDLWHLGPFGSLNPMTFISGETYERVNFLSDDVLIISGFIQEGGKKNFIYRSEDGGETWSKVVFGKSSWIDAAHFTKNGKGWMSGSSQLIYYTEDYGKTWISKEKVEKTGNLRFSTIHFDKDQHVGVFGSFWNKIYRTTDNCETWELIETPLRQGKYERVSKGVRPDIRKIRILGDYYLVNQQGKIYYSKAHKVDWIPLTEVVDFEVSEYTGYLITKDFKLQIIDENLDVISISKNSLSSFPRALKVIDTTLYAYAGEEIFRVTPSAFERTGLLTNDIPIPEPYTQVKYRHETYGFQGTDILKLRNGRWQRILNSPFPIGNVALFQNELVIADNALSARLKLDVESNELHHYELPEDIIGTDRELKSLIIGVGSMGCFHHDDNTRIYHRKGDDLKLAESGGFLNSMPRKIEMTAVNKLISVANNSRIDELSIEDLDLQPSHYSDFKSFITKREKEIKRKGMDSFGYDDPYKFPGEQTDFEFYKKVADSLINIDNSVISKVFSKGYGNWSTTRVWHQLILNFQNGSKMIISNADDIPNYLYAPWIINYDGLEYKTNSLELGQLINKLTKGSFFENYADDPNYAIFKIADYLYRQKLKGI